MKLILPNCTTWHIKFEKIEGNMKYKIIPLTTSNEVFEHLVSVNCSSAGQKFDYAFFRTQLPLSILCPSSKKTISKCIHI